MSDQKQGFIDYITRMLPEDEKAKAGEYVTVMEEYFQKIQDMFGAAYDENRLPPMLRVGLVRRMVVTAATIEFLTEGPQSLIETGKAVAMNAIAAHTKKELERQKEQKIVIAKNMPKGGLDAKATN